jgi:hypothetical protein
MNANLWTVTRQRYWDDGAEVVEVAQGGRDYSNPDALCARYSGEFEEFTDPREAINTAIEILKAWRADSKHPRKIRLALGCTHGNTLPFEPITIRDARKAAAVLYEKAPKCAECGDVLGRETYSHEHADGDSFCREYCAEKNWARYYEDDAAEA